MRTLPIAILVSLLLAACGADSDAGCQEGQSSPCTCADGADGRRECGTDACVCPGCEEGEVVSCTCEDGALGEKPCGAETCSCEPECREGELVPCTCADGAEGEKPCGAEACTCEPECREGELVPCTCADGAEGEKPCGAETCTCEPECREGELVPCTCADGTEGEKLCGAEACGCGEWPECLSVEPGTIAFAPATARCGDERVAVSVTNGCAEGLVLRDLSLSGPEAFELVGFPPLPASLAPGASVSLDVAYRPREPGGHQGELEVAVAGLEPRAAALYGVAEELPWTVDTFQDPPPRQLDVLFVLDNATSMAAHVPALEGNLLPFISFLDANEIDWHVGVTTTGLVPGGECPGGVGGGEDGRLFPVDGSAVRVLAPDTKDVEAEWRKLIAVGACRTGPNMVFEAAVRALTPPVADNVDDPRHPESGDGNLGFLRQDAMLVVIAVTNRDDQSPESVNHYFNALASVKGHRRDRFNFIAIAGDPVSGCEDGRTGAAEPGDRLEAMAVRTNGGLAHSICDPDWGEVFREMSAGPVWGPSCYHLTEVPVDLNENGAILEADGEIEVELNGRVISSTGAQGQRVWTYSEGWNAVCFEPLARPPAGSLVEVSYHAPCP